MTLATLTPADVLSSTQTGQHGRTLIHLHLAHNQLLDLAAIDSSGYHYPALIQLTWDTLQVHIQERLDYVTDADAANRHPRMILKNVARHLRDTQVLHRTLAPHFDLLDAADSASGWTLVDDNLAMLERADVLLEQAAELSRATGYAL